MKRSLGWLGLILGAGVSLGAVLMPWVLMSPTRPQTERDLRLGYSLMGWGTALTVVLLLAGTALTVYLWKKSRFVPGRLAMAVCLVLLGAAVWGSTQNVSEWMFKPLAEPGFIPVAEVDFLEPNDMVLGIRLGEEARAYPIRLLAYHHILHGELNGVPYAATY